MRLFTKTLLFFISVILFQASLMLFFTTNLTKRSNLEDALKEVKQEAVLAVENYNSWKRGMWKTVMEMQSDRRFAEILQLADAGAVNNALTQYLKTILHESGIDVGVVRHSAHDETDILAITYNNFSLEDVQHLRNQKPHPYLELNLVGVQLCIIGILRLEIPGTSAYVDLFLLKRIDREFCQELVLNRSAQVSFFLDTRYLTGTVDQESFPPISDLTRSDRRLYEMYDLALEQPGYNLALRKIDTIQMSERQRTLWVMTMLPNTPYITRLRVLEKTLLSVTIVSGVVTILLSLFLSRNITHPISNLLAATQRIQSGNYDTTIDLDARNEIGELVHSFNAMAQKIHQDKVRMESYIHEITLLKDYNEKILQSIKEGLMIVNRHFVIEKVNSALLEAFKANEADIVGSDLHDYPLEIVDDDVIEHVQAILTSTRADDTIIKRPPSRQVYEIKLYPIITPDESLPESPETLGCVCVIEEITRKIEFEERIFQAEKLSSISMLSAGVAHEINNPLGSIMTNVQNLIAEEADAEKSVALTWIEQETRRIARIVRKLLDFASSHLDRTQGADVNIVIEDTITLIQYSLQKHQEITITTDLAENLPLAAISQDELKQVLINLVKNAIQAITGQGDIRITTRNHQDEQTLSVTITDTGIGIPEESLPRIFDPFYTTKQNGEGTGLGLSVVYGIIKKYDGTISVTSQAGQGTQVYLTIPYLERRNSA